MNEPSGSAAHAGQSHQAEEWQPLRRRQVCPSVTDECQLIRSMPSPTPSISSSPSDPPGSPMPSNFLSAHVQLSPMACSFNARNSCAAKSLLPRPERIDVSPPPLRNPPHGGTMSTSFAPDVIPLVVCGTPKRTPRVHKPENISSGVHIHGGCMHHNVGALAFAARCQGCIVASTASGRAVLLLCQQTCAASPVQCTSSTAHAMQIICWLQESLCSAGALQAVAAARRRLCLLPTSARSSALAELCCLRRSNVILHRMISLSFGH
jgi:hypothetical protein